MEKFHTPGLRTIDQLVESLQIQQQDMIKTLIYMADDQPIAVVVRGDHEINEVKFKHVLGSEKFEIASSDTVSKATGTPSGFIGSYGLTILSVVLMDDREERPGVKFKDSDLLYIIRYPCLVECDLLQVQSHKSLPYGVPETGLACPGLS
ncbi:YbaK/EbsC family protein [Paenibacillus terrae]|nr:YbaK/EbsC family protein [Paenibacillus terrae]